MLLELVLLVKCAAIGFVAAGLLSSLYQLVTNRTPRFVPDFEGFAGFAAASVLCALAGPFIIMRNAIRGHRIEQRPLGWLAASSAVAFGWSACSGLVVLYTVVTLTRV